MLPRRSIDGPATRERIFGKRDVYMIVLGSLLVIAASGIYYVMPAFLAEAEESLGLRPGQIGSLSSAESASIAVSATLAGFTYRHIGWKTLSLLALLCAAGDSITLLAHSFPALMIVRILTGLCAEGPLFAASYAILGATKRPERGFAVSLAALSLLGAIVLSQERAFAALGFEAILLPLAAAALGAAVLMMADRRVKMAQSMMATPGNLKTTTIRTPLLYLAGIATWFGAPGMFWAFADTAATAKHFNQSDIGSALSLSVMGSLVGSLLPLLISPRLDRTTIVVIATGGLVASAFLNSYAGTYLALMLSLTAFMGFWNFTSVYQFGLLASSSSSARYTALGASAQLLGLSLGPAVGGMLLDHWGYESMASGTASFAVVGALLFVVGSISNRRFGTQVLD